MRLQIDRDVLAEAVAWTTRVLPARPPVPVLTGVLLVAVPDGLQLSAFDYEVSARMTAPAQVSDEGRVLVQGRLLSDIARTLPNKPVTLFLDGSKLRVEAGSSRFALPLMPVEEYPQLPPPPERVGTIPGEVFGAAVSQVAIAAARDETPPVLTAVRVEIDGRSLSLVATDRYRLALREVEWAGDDAGDERAFLVRARTLNDIAKSLGAGSDVEIGLSSGPGELLGISAGGRRTTVPLMDGAYPPVRRLFPEASDTTVVVETALLIDGVRRMALIGDRAPVRLTVTENEIVLDAGTGEDAQASDALAVEAVDGPGLSIGFNTSYLLDGLAATGAKYVRLAFTQPSKPVLLSGHDSADAADSRGYTYLLMPTRVAGRADG